MTSALIESLVGTHGYPVVDESTLHAFLDDHTHCVLFFTEDPHRYPESNDVAVILPEIMKVFANRCAVAVVSREAEKSLQKRFGFGAWPALVLMRGDGYLGAITRVQD
jgi:hydrogenase-1 operon protein HyaE